jgi:hypothetical protein
MSAEASYALPVAGLLTIGDLNNNGVEAQIAALGLGQEHVPELVRMAVDPELNSAAGDSLEVWAPLHALHALKGLDASAHAADLMPLVELHEDDWFREELTCSFAMDALVDLEAAEALSAIRHAFELDKIDPMVRGPWDVIVDQIGGEIDPDDPLIALFRQRGAERRERFFPSHLRRQLSEALGMESESPFARLMRERGVIPDSPMAPLAGQVALQQVEDRARKEKQKRKASSAARKANRKKK